MPIPVTDSDLIDSYKRDFELKTGKCLKVKICSRWETLCSLPAEIDMKILINMILDATEWKFEEVFTTNRSRKSVYQRGLIYFVLATNNYSLLKLAKYTDKDHTTIIHARRNFEQQLDTEPLTSILLREIMTFIHQNYQFYVK